MSSANQGFESPPSPTFNQTGFQETDNKDTNHGFQLPLGNDPFKPQPSADNGFNGFSQGGFQPVSDEDGFKPQPSTDPGFGQTGFQPQLSTDPGFGQTGFQETDNTKGNEGYQSSSDDDAFKPKPSTDPGFGQPDFNSEGFQAVSDDDAFKPKPSTDPGFNQTGFQETLNTDEMFAFAKGSAAGVPIGYNHGIAHGEAASQGKPTPELLSLGFIDTNEKKAYGQGYQYGWAQGFSLGYVEGLKKLGASNNGGFSQGGFTETGNNGGFSQGGFKETDNNGF